MSRLTWEQRDHGWRAGPYEIELVAPQLWVCSRHRSDGGAVVELTSGSLSALKARVELMDHRRSCMRRSLLHLSVFVASMVAAVLVATIEATVVPALAIALVITGFWSALKAVDCVVRRSWESLHLTYQ